MFFWPCDIQFFFCVFIYWTDFFRLFQVGTKYKSSLPVQLGGDLLIELDDGTILTGTPQPI